MASADLTRAVLRLPDRDVLVISVYVEGKHEEMLLATMEMLHTQVTTFRNASGRRTDVILAGDFNRHDHLWEGDDVIGRRQGEAGPIVGLMDEHSLLSLLPRGTKTWENAEHSSTIDLILASAELAEDMVACGIHPTEHGSDHRAIRTEFDLGVPEGEPANDGCSRTHRGQQSEKEWRKGSDGCHGTAVCRPKRTASWGLCSKQSTSSCR